MKASVITGMGVISPGYRGSAKVPCGQGNCGSIDLDQFELNQRRLRFADRLTCLGLGAALYAPPFTDLAPEQIGVVLGIDYGVYLSCYEFDQGLSQADPSPGIFPYTVPNILAGQISIHLGLQGPGITVTGCWTAGLEALGCAADLLTSGAAEGILAGAVTVQGTALKVFGCTDITEGAVLFTLRRAEGPAITHWNASTRLAGENQQHFLRRHWQTLPWQSADVQSLWGNLPAEYGEQVLGLPTTDIRTHLGELLATSGPAALALALQQPGSKLITVVPPDYRRAVSLVIST